MWVENSNHWCVLLGLLWIFMLLAQSLKQQHITLIVLWHIMLNFVTHPIEFPDTGFDLMANARRGACRHLRGSSLGFFFDSSQPAFDSGWKPRSSFLCFSSHFHLSLEDAVQDVLILCMVNTQIGLVWGNWCEINISVNTTPPGAFLWSIIYVLKRAKELYLKINFFAFPVFSSLKEMRVWGIYVDAPGECQTGQAVWLRKEEEGIIKKRKSPPRLFFFRCKVNVVPCWQGVLSVCALPSFSHCRWPPLI